MTKELIDKIYEMKQQLLDYRTQLAKEFKEAITLGKSEDSLIEVKFDITGCKSCTILPAAFEKGGEYLSSAIAQAINNGALATLDYQDKLINMYLERESSIVDQLCDMFMSELGVAEFTPEMVENFKKELN